MIWIVIDNVKKFGVVKTTNIELEFKSEYSFRTYSVATNLVRSLEFNSIRCATMLCLFGRTRNGSVATHFILLNSTSTSSAISGYVGVLERFGPNEEPVTRNEERTRNEPSFVRRKIFIVCSKITCQFLTCKYDFSPFYFFWCIQ